MAIQSVQSSQSVQSVFFSGVQVDSDSLTKLFLQLDLRIIASVSLVSRTLHDVTLGSPQFLALYLDRYFPEFLQYSRVLARPINYNLCIKATTRHPHDLFVSHNEQIFDYMFIRGWASSTLHCSMRDEYFLVYDILAERVFMDVWDYHGRRLESFFTSFPSLKYSPQINDGMLTILSPDGVVTTYEYREDENVMVTTPLSLVLEEEVVLDDLSCFHKQGDRIVVCLMNGIIKLWNQKGTLLKTLQEENSASATSLHMSDACVVAGFSNGIVKIWNREGFLLKELTEYQTKGDNPVSYLLMQDGGLFAGFDSNSPFTIWSLEKFKLLKTIRTAENVRFVVADDYLITVSDECVEIWNLDNSDQPMRKFSKDVFHNRDMHDSHLMRNNRLLHIFKNREIRVWDFNGQPFLSDIQIITKQDCYSKLGYSPDFLQKTGLRFHADLKRLGLFSDSTENQIDTLKDYLQQTGLHDMWRAWNHMGIYTLSELLEKRPDINPFKMVSPYHTI
jgi:WD40 repeat protein